MFNSFARCSFFFCVALCTSGASAQSTAAIVTRSIPIGVSTTLGIQSLPNASCLIHLTNQTDSDQSLRVYTNDRGVLHFSVQRDVASTQKYEIDCTGDNGVSQIVPVVVTSSSTAANVSKDESVTLPDVGVVQPALGPDPMSITPQQLSAAGYPRRPDPIKSPALYKIWSDMVTRQNQRISIKAIPRTDLTPFSNNANQAWFGWEQTQAVFVETGASWTVPRIGFSNTVGQRSRIAFWTGVDMINGTSNVLAQAGVDQQSIVTCCALDIVDITFTSFPWLEYANDAYIPIGMTITPGDFVVVYVWLSDINQNVLCQGGWMTAFIYNYSTGIYGAGMAPVPQGTSFACGLGHMAAEFMGESFYSRNGNYLPQFSDLNGNTFSMTGVGWDWWGVERGVNQTNMSYNKWILNDSHGNLMANSTSNDPNSWAINFNWYRSN